jgi:hypothetical protein
VNWSHLLLATWIALVASAFFALRSARLASSFLSCAVDSWSSDVKPAIWVLHRIQPLFLPHVIT